MINSKRISNSHFTILALCICIAIVKCVDIVDYNPWFNLPDNDKQQENLDNQMQQLWKNFLKKFASTNQNKSPKENERNFHGPNSNLRTSNDSRNGTDIFNLWLTFIKPYISDPNYADKIYGLKIYKKLCPINTDISCNQKQKYQSFDGSCNNLKKPWLGKSGTPFKRYLAPEYSDKLNRPRNLSVSGRALPNPRLLSRILHTENQRLERIWTNLYTHFGQILAHELTSLSVTSDASGNPLSCPCNSTNPECYSILMPQDENIMKMSCVQFTRSSAAFPTAKCNVGYREQLNLLSSFIDGGIIYGSSKKQCDSLRLNSGGLLKTSLGVSLRKYLPKSANERCGSDPLSFCFVAGESRANENLALTSVHTLFVRTHNRIATELANTNPKWNDDRLFYEARRILVAILQHIVYSEFVPSIIGFGSSKITPLTDGYFYGYNPNVNPSISNEFAAAAFRFGHSIVRNELNRSDSQNNVIVGASVNISKIMFNVDEAYNSQYFGLESIMVGLVGDASSRADLAIADTLQNHLFEKVEADGSITAIDLAATNINRGRDHGLPPYVKYRELCGLKPALTFQDLIGEMTQDVINKLASAYEDVADVDLWVGGLAENTRTNISIVGPTFKCLIENQFYQLKTGDRFYYENAPSSSLGTSTTAFSLDQLNEIRKVSLSMLICKEFDIDSIQPNAFFTTVTNNTLAPNNQLRPCSSYQSFDFKKWLDQPSSKPDESDKSDESDNSQELNDLDD